MGTIIQLTSSDGHAFDVYRADPEGTPKGGVLVIQEIFGVNSHIRDVTDGYAAEGYVAMAPALFDRVERNVEVGYDQAGFSKGFGIVQQLKPAQTLADIQATARALAASGKVGVVGYCWGGTMTYLAACKVEGIACASAYYGGQIAKQLDNKPEVPTIMHFGDKDRHIPPGDVQKVREANPDCPVYVYPADHGFNCDQRGSYHEESAKLARQRTLELFAKHIA